MKKLILPAIIMACLVCFSLGCDKDKHTTGTGNATTSTGADPELLQQDPALDIANAYAREAEWNGEWDKAIAEFTKVIQANPKSDAAYYRRGLCWHAKGEISDADSDFNKAIDDYTAAIRINPQHSLAYTARAWSFLMMDRFDEAIADCTKSIELNPNDTRTYNCRALAYTIGTDEYDKAIIDRTETIRLDPKNPDAYFGRGKAYEAKGDMVKARADFARAKELGYMP